MCETVHLLMLVIVSVLERNYLLIAGVYNSNADAVDVHLELRHSETKWIGLVTRFHIG